MSAQCTQIRRLCAQSSMHVQHRAWRSQAPNSRQQLACTHRQPSNWVKPRQASTLHAAAHHAPGSSPSLTLQGLHHHAVSQVLESLRGSATVQAAGLLGQAGSKLPSQPGLAQVQLTLHTAISEVMPVPVHILPFLLFVPLTRMPHLCQQTQQMSESSQRVMLSASDQDSAI